MTARWQEYQEEVADLFRSLGCSVEVEKEIEGARGVHVVDVVAKIAVGGISVTWIVECKLWNAAIPKEKVLVLSEVASDVGADRAFLLSESGFQSGAIRATQNSNITLTSLSELFESVRQEIQHRELAALERKAHFLQRRLYDLMILDDGSRGPPPGASMEAVVELLATVFELKTLALPAAQANEYPISISARGILTRFEAAPPFIEAAASALDLVEDGLATELLAVQRLQGAAREKFGEFSCALGRFLHAAEGALRPVWVGPDESVAHLHDLVDRMRAVGDQAAELRKLICGIALRKLTEVMKGPVDRLYVLLHAGLFVPVTIGRPTSGANRVSWSMPGSRNWVCFFVLPPSRARISPGRT